MALGFQRQGIFGRRNPMDMQPQSQAMPQANAMPIGVEQITKKPGFFGKDSALWKVLGTLGDTFSDGPPIYTESVLQQRDAEERARMAQQQRMQKREDMQWEWQNKPKDDSPKDQLTRFMVAAGIDPNSPRARELYARAVENEVNPIQAVPFTDAQGNSGFQYVRPSQMQGTAAPTSKAEYDALPPGAQYRAPDGSIRTKGGSGGNVTGGFQRP
jgi:hypothetical protein